LPELLISLVYSLLWKIALPLKRIVLGIFRDAMGSNTFIYVENAMFLWKFGMVIVSKRDGA
jgi:hypothetical protein